MGINLHDRLQALAEQMVSESCLWASEVSVAAVEPSSFAASYSSFHDIVRRVGHVPDPADFDAEIRRFDIVVSNLGPQASPSGSAPGDRADHFDDYTPSAELRSMARVQDGLEGWRGETAREFRRNILTPFQTSYARNQWVMATVLRDTVKAMQAVWVGQADVILRIAEEHLRAIEGRGEARPIAESDDSSSFGLSIVDVAGLLIGVASVVLAPPTGGGSAVLTVGGFGAGFLSGYEYDSGKPEYGVPNTSAPADVMASLEANVDLFCRTISDAERMIAEFLQKVLDQAYDNLDLFGFRGSLDAQHGTHPWTHEGGWTAEATT